MEALLWCDVVAGAEPPRTRKKAEMSQRAQRVTTWEPVTKWGKHVPSPLMLNPLVPERPAAGSAACGGARTDVRLQHGQHLGRVGHGQDALQRALQRRRQRVRARRALGALQVRDHARRLQRVVLRAPAWVRSALVPKSVQ